MDSHKKVTRSEFNRIVCNNCGACCETVWQPSPLGMALLIGRNVVLGDILAWWSDLEPSEASVDRNGNLQRYRCLRFVRLEDGSGFCSDYTSRPVACRTFPDGLPVHAAGFEACSWNVDIIEEEDLRQQQDATFEGVHAGLRPDKTSGSSEEPDLIADGG